MSRSEEESLGQLSDDDAEKLSRCLHLAELLNNSITGKDYKPALPLTAAMKFTVRGSRLANQVKGDGIDLREAQLAVFIECAVGDSLLVDVTQIDLTPIEDAISSEVRRGKVRIPWIYGRSLYDAVADAGLNESPFPTPDETSNLLKDGPQGVFQHGPYVVGPSGIRESVEWRYIPARTSVPALHCEEPNCNAVHAIHLTSFRVGVTRAQDAIRERNERSRRSGNQLVEIADSVEIKKQPPYRWNNMDGLPFFLADCFNVDERRKLLVRLLNDTSGAMRSRCTLAFPDESVTSANRLGDGEVRGRTYADHTSSLRCRNPHGIKSADLERGTDNSRWRDPQCSHC